ncbi:MAG TPA: phytanoyl-CoA dioxygenase family protein [Acidimicrobiales bacterium]|nr:phytanoyl-CoA dioxygenase family protein [Acidimicrobiales bacterium]
MFRDPRTNMQFTHVTSPSYDQAVLPAFLISELQSEGIIRLGSAFDPSAADAMRERVWRELSALGINEADRSTWPSGRQGKAVGSSRLQADSRFEAFWSKDVVAAVDALLGAGCWTRPAAVELLLTFPEADGPLRVLDPFHSDFAMDVSCEPLFAVNTFAFVGAVAPRSGGTLVIRGSHRVVQHYLSALPPGFPRNRAASQFATDNPWLASLGSFDDPVGVTHDADGIDIGVEELIGEPGDVFIAHPWTLHAGITSRGTTPRMMLRHRILRSSQ